MINIEAYTIDLGGVSTPIIGVETWFRTPLGLFLTLDEAIEACKSVDFLPQINIIPVTVAVCANKLHEEWVR